MILRAERSALDTVNNTLNGGWGMYGMFASRETLEAHRDRLQGEIAALAQGDQYGPPFPARRAAPALLRRRFRPIKGEHLAGSGNDDTNEKRVIGALWEKASAGTGLFAMIEKEDSGRDMRGQLLDAINRSSLRNTV